MYFCILPECYHSETIQNASGSGQQASLCPWIIIWSSSWLPHIWRARRAHRLLLSGTDNATCKPPRSARTVSVRWRKEKNAAEQALNGHRELVESDTIQWPLKESSLNCFLRLLSGVFKPYKTLFVQSCLWIVLSVVFILKFSDNLSCTRHSCLLQGFWPTARCAFWSAHAILKPTDCFALEARDPQATPTQRHTLSFIFPEQKWDSPSWWGVCVYKGDSLALGKSGHVAMNHNTPSHMYNT